MPESSLIRAGWITRVSGWQNYDWNPVSGTHYFHRMAYAPVVPPAEGFVFSFTNPIRK
jgi:hypothetical protein